MLDNMETMIDWSRAQFALTAMYHWLFVPLTLGLAVIMGVMETRYVIFVGDIFGAPLAIEGIVAFFMEATFVAVMFFGWDKVGKKFHLASTWLTGLGATLSAWWILVANSWMQYPVGMVFNPETVRNEMVDFLAVAFSPVAVMKFLHTVLSSWIVGAVFVIGVSGWFLLKRREKEFALASMKIAACTGMVASLLTLYSGDKSAYQVAQYQPMKLAAMEALYEGGTRQPLTVVGEWKIPTMLSFLATRNPDGYVPGIHNILAGGHQSSVRHRKDRERQNGNRGLIGFPAGSKGRRPR